MLLYGTPHLSDDNECRTARRFAPWTKATKGVFLRYFGIEPFAGSLNVLVHKPSTLQTDLDRKKPLASIVMPQAQLMQMAPGLGDGQAWSCRLTNDKLPEPIKCWIFRRIGSRVAAGIIEIIAREPLIGPFKVCHGDEVTIEVK